MKRSVAAIIGLVLAAVTLVAAPASAAAPYCGIRWGSLAKSVADTSPAPVTGVRAGRHACCDRIVLDVGGAVAGFDADGYPVEYVAQVTQDGSGEVIPVRGGARLQLVANNPSYEVDTGAPTYSPADRNELVDVSGFRTLRQVASAGSFEGFTSIGVGVRARLPFRVFVLDGPGSGSRLVVDVAHRW